MDKKKIAAFFLCAVLFVGALVLSLNMSGSGKSSFTGSSNSVILSEILASNRSYPAPNREYLDFIELRNVSSSAVDISGYMLSDDGVSIGYTFPAGSVLQPNEYILCWCSSDDDSGEYANFGISRDGGETIYLYNAANVVIDSVALPRSNSNIPLVRLDNGDWSSMAQATPGYENTDAGYAAYLHSMGGSDMQIVINEIMSSNGCTLSGSGEAFTDWVELKNVGLSTVDLCGAWLSDDPADPMKWQIGSLSLAPGQCAVIACTGKDAREGEADFALSASGCSVVLTGSMGNTLSAVDCPALGRDTVYALIDGAYSISAQATPGYDNTEKGVKAYLEAFGSFCDRLYISEVQSSSRSGILNAAGQLCDWVEIYNGGRQSVDLSGFYLSDDSDERGKWQFPSLVLEGGSYALVCLSGASAAEGEADFALSADGSSLILSGRAGNIISSVEIPRMEPDRSYALCPDGSFAVSTNISPGFENSDEGHLAYLASCAPSAGLIISEVMPSNDRFLIQSDGKYYDWVELFNASAHSVQLSDYFLSDNADEPFLFRLPETELAPGQRFIVICSGNSGLTGRYVHAPFTLSRQESWLYLSRGDGSFSDYLRIYDVPGGYSVGRAMGTGAVCYFAQPGPGEENGGGLSLISPTPEILTADGVFNGVSDIKVELSGEGTLRYTTDGSIPTENSPVYTGPISLKSTAVIRAASFVEGKLPSDTVTAAYIINENHSLPVLSLTAEPAELFGIRGIYTNSTRGVEIPCNLKLFENGQGFSIDGGLKMYGHTGLNNPKKSFKVNFGGRYGEKVLAYPVYGEEGCDIYDALVIRSGQDYPFSIFRDELFTSLCLEMGDDVVAQRDKFCILYINGEYYGIFCLKEAFTEMLYASKKDFSPDSVTLTQAPVGTDSELFWLFDYCHDNDLSQQEHYDYVCSKVDIDSLIDWMIIQGWCCNGDVQQNLRYYKSSETGDKWAMAYYDLDWAFYYHNPFDHIFDGGQLLQHETLTMNMIKNPQFREKFLSRAGELMNGVLSTEHVLERIDHYEQLLSPEVERERAMWGGSPAGWQMSVESLRSFIRDTDHWGSIISAFRRLIGLTDAEAALYFGR